MDHVHDHGEHRPRSGTLVNWMIAGLVLVAAYFVIGEHWVHVAPYFPFLIFLSCPLMHLFMHHGHHGGHGQAPRSNPHDEESSQ